MANYAQNVNVIGCIKTTTIASAFDATALPLILYRHHFGTIPVEISGEIGNMDVSAALTSDGKAITVAIVNPTVNQEIISLNFGNTLVKKECVKWTIHNPDPLAYNEPGKTPNIVIREENIKFTKNGFKIPGYSIVMFRLEMQKSE